MFGKILFFIGLVAAGLLFVILNLTVPSQVGAVGILAVFLLAYSIALSSTTFLLWASARLLSRVGRETRWLRAGEALSFRQAYYYATVIALAPVMVISLQSVGGVGVYEIGLILLLVALGCVYVSRRLK